MTRKKLRTIDKHGPCCVRTKRSRYSLMGRVWIEGNEKTFLGHGRVTLLERIHQYGSIAEAAKSLGMSYRRAWDLIESMNSQANRPLVEKATGGKGGGGTRLTEEGKRTLQLFWEFHHNFQLFLEKQSKIVLFE
jgi:molybdate transport system regulatory protein